jgi:acyl carrier protein
MMRTSLEAQVTEILRERLGLGANGIDLGTRLADLGMDSIDVLEFALAAERRFQISLSEAQMAQATTVADVVALLETRIGAQPT